MIGGGGGGRPELAQAGGKDPSKIGEALDAPSTSLCPEQQSPRRRRTTTRARARRSTTTSVFQDLLGHHDEHLKAIERILGVRIIGAAARTLLISRRRRCERELAGRVLSAALRRPREGLSDLPERRRLRGAHPQPRSHRQPARDLPRHHLHLVAQARDHAEEHRAEALHRRHPQLRHRLRHRPRRHRQDLPRHGHGGRRADEGQVRAHDPDAARRSRPARSSASCPATWPRR